MYWCKLKLKHIIALLGGIMLLSGLQACRPDNVQSGAAPKYFDLAGYFKADTARLKKLNPQVNKTVTHNGVTENKTVQIGNWGQELNLFIQSDINRPAWKNSYTTTTFGDLVIYKAKDPELRTSKVIINRDKGKIKWILIFNHTKNLLYETSEKLSYFPDSAYQIDKSQHVKLMGQNLYHIKGLFELPKK